MTRGLFPFSISGLYTIYELSNLARKLSREKFRPKMDLRGRRNPSGIDAVNLETSLIWSQKENLQSPIIRRFHKDAVNEMNDLKQEIIFLF